MTCTRAWITCQTCTSETTETRNYISISVLSKETRLSESVTVVLREKTCFVGQTYRTCNMNVREYDAIRSTVIVLNIALNTLAIAVIARYPQLREDRATLFMFSLALSDLANGCTTMPVSAAVCSSVHQVYDTRLTSCQRFTPSAMFGSRPRHCKVSVG